MLYHVSNHLFKSKNYLFSHTNNFPYKNSIGSISRVSQTNQRYAYSSSITNHLFKSKNYLFSHTKNQSCAIENKDRGYYNYQLSFQKFFKSSNDIYIYHLNVKLFPRMENLVQ